MFVFPQRTLAPGECVLVFADSTYADGADGYHAPSPSRRRAIR